MYQVKERPQIFTPKMTSFDPLISLILISKRLNDMILFLKQIYFFLVLFAKEPKQKKRNLNLSFKVALQNNLNLSFPFRLNLSPNNTILFSYPIVKLSFQDMLRKKINSLRRDYAPLPKKNLIFTVTELCNLSH